MSVETAIRSRWSGYSPLTNLVPITRFRVGWLPREDTDWQTISLPFVSMSRLGDDEVLTPSGGITITTTEIGLNIWANSLSEAKQIADAANKRFANKNWTYEEGLVILMRHRDRSESEEDSGVWLAALKYFVTTQEPAT